MQIASRIVNVLEIGVQFRFSDYLLLINLFINSGCAKFYDIIFQSDEIIKLNFVCSRKTFSGMNKPFENFRNSEENPLFKQIIDLLASN